MSDNTQTEGAAILKEMVAVANPSKLWAKMIPCDNIRAIAAYVEALEAENKAMLERVAQADRRHDETVEMMREMLAERDNEIACLTALKDHPHD